MSFLAKLKFTNTILLISQGKYSVEEHFFVCMFWLTSIQADKSYGRGKNIAPMIRNCNFVSCTFFYTIEAPVASNAITSINSY